MQPPRNALRLFLEIWLLTAQALTTVGLARKILLFLTVLGSARIGLIFTRIQEGAQPGGLTPPGQTEQGIPYHVPSCWVPVGGGLGGKNTLAARECGRWSCPRERVCCASLCHIFSLSVSLLLLFPLFAVLLNCPYPNP